MIIKYLSSLILVFICFIYAYKCLLSFIQSVEKKPIVLQNDLSFLKFQSYRFADVTAHDWRLTDSNIFTREQSQETSCIHFSA